MLINHSDIILLFFASRLLVIDAVNYILLLSVLNTVLSTCQEFSC